MLEEACGTCAAQQRQTRRMRLLFNMARLTLQAPGLLFEPELQTCVLCDARVPELFAKLAEHAGRVRALATCTLLHVGAFPQTWCTLEMCTRRMACAWSSTRFCLQGV